MCENNTFKQKAYWVLTFTDKIKLNAENFFSSHFAKYKILRIGRTIAQYCGSCNFAPDPDTHSVP